MQGEHFSPEQVLVGGIQPNLIVGACLGAAFVFSPDKDSDIVGRPLENVRYLADLPAPASLLEHPLIRRWTAQIAAVRRARPDLRVIPPFFLGHVGPGHDPRLPHHRAETVRRRGLRARVTMNLSSSSPCTTGSLPSTSRLIRHFARWATADHLGAHRRVFGHDAAAGALRAVRDRLDCRLGGQLGPVRLHSCGRCDHLLAAIASSREPGQPGHRVEHLGRRDPGAVRRGFPHRPGPAGRAVGGGRRPRRRGGLAGAYPGGERRAGPLHIGFHLEPGYSVANCQSIHDELRLRDVQ